VRFGVSFLLPSWEKHAVNDIKVPVTLSCGQRGLDEVKIGWDQGSNPTM